MNDTIMASVAALKSRSLEPHYSAHTTFRSVRGSGTAKRNNTKVDIAPDVLSHFKDIEGDLNSQINAALRSFIAHKS